MRARQLRRGEPILSFFASYSLGDPAVPMFLSVPRKSENVPEKREEIHRDFPGDRRSYVRGAVSKHREHRRRVRVAIIDEAQ